MYELCVILHEGVRCRGHHEERTTLRALRGEFSSFPPTSVLPGLLEPLQHSESFAPRSIRTSICMVIRVQHTSKRNQNVRTEYNSRVQLSPPCTLPQYRAPWSPCLRRLSTGCPAGYTPCHSRPTKARTIGGISENELTTPKSRKTRKQNPRVKGTAVSSVLCIPRPSTVSRA